METTTTIEALDKVTLDTWNVDKSDNISSFLARRALVLDAVEDFEAELDFAA